MAPEFSSNIATCGFAKVAAFLRGVKEYLERHVFSNATSSDLWHAMTAISGVNVERLMQEWTKHVGYPILLVSEDAATSSITLEQHRYLQSDKVTPEEDENLYQIPLKFCFRAFRRRYSSVITSLLLFRFKGI